MRAARIGASRWHRLRGLHSSVLGCLLHAPWGRGGAVVAAAVLAGNPIPRVNDDNKGLHDPSSCPGPGGQSGPGCIQFPPACPQDVGREPWSTDGSGQGACSGDWTAGLIADRVKIPPHVPPGDYVLGEPVSLLRRPLAAFHQTLSEECLAWLPSILIKGWRWDCEETAQIWCVPPLRPVASFIRSFHPLKSVWRGFDRLNCADVTIEA
eukprot:COSAG01_NODE_3187_length_6441_cov_16.292179_3_plen_209_part_00